MTEPQCRLVIDCTGHVDVVEVCIEVSGGLAAGTMDDPERCERGVTGRTREALGVQVTEVTVNLEEPGTIERCEGTALHVVDWRAPARGAGAAAAAAILGR